MDNNQIPNQSQVSDKLLQPTNPAREPSRYEQKKQEKELNRAKSDRQKSTKKFLKYAIFVVVFVAVFTAIGVWLKNQGPKGPDFSHAIPVQGRDHIEIGSTHPDYNSNPPTSGPHYAAPFNRSTSDKEIPDEQIVHNLEHGHVWISYRPTVPAEVIEALQDLAAYNVLITPRAKNETDIAVAAWGRLDTFNLENGAFDLERIKDFIRRYANHAPENVPI